jgi:hypothetical protein
LVDLIRSGKAPEVIRRKGAEGNLPLPLEDKIEILTLLAATGDSAWRQKALDTLRGWDPVEIRRVMASPQTAPGVLRFAAEQLLHGREELREILLWNPSLPPETRTLMQPKQAPKPKGDVAVNSPPHRIQLELVTPPRVPEAAKESPSQPQPECAPKPAEGEVAVEILAKLSTGAKIEDVTGTLGDAMPEVSNHDDELTQKDRETLIEKINRMTVVEKIRAALTGNMETRSLLIRDSNKMISRAVLLSPKISDTEAESYAAAKNVSEEVLRLIAANRKFVKTYVVMRALVNNPRAPIDVTMPLVARINDRDLKGLSLNRNVPEVIRTLAIKAIKHKEEASNLKLRR